MDRLKAFIIFAALLATFIAGGFYIASETDAATVCPIFLGCTGTSTTPQYGQVLVGSANGQYSLMSTSSLGITASNAASSTLLRDSNTFTGTTIFATTTAGNLNGVIYVTGFPFPQSPAGISAALNICSLLYNVGLCGKVHMATGNYATTTSIINIPSHMTLEGEGETTYLPFDVGGGIFINGTGTSTLSNFKIDAKTDTTKKVIAVTDAGDVIFDHMTVLNAYNNAIFIYSTNVNTPTNAVWVTNSYLTGQGIGDVIGGGPLDSNAEDVRDVYILDNYIISGPTIDGASAINLVKAHDHTAIGNHIWGSMIWGNEKDPNTQSIQTGNIVTGVSDNGIVCSSVGTLNSSTATSTSSNITISGNTLKNAYIKVINATSSATTTLVSITGNTIDAANCTYGIRVENIIGSSITGNPISNASDSDIYLFGASYNSVTANPLSNAPTGVKVRNSSLVTAVGNDISANPTLNIPRQYDVDDISATTTVVRLLKIVTANEPFNTNGGLIVSGTSTAQEALGFYDQAHAYWNSNGFNLKTEESPSANGGLSHDFTLGTNNRSFTIHDGGFTNGGTYDFNWGAVNFFGTSIFYIHGTAQGISNYQAGIYLAPIVNQTGSADFEAIRTNMTETTVGSNTNYLFRGMKNGIDAFVVLDNGNIGIGTTTPGNSALSANGNVFIAGNITSTSTIASVFPYASTTGITTNVASTSLLYANGLGGCIAGQYLTWSAGAFGCATAGTITSIITGSGLNGGAITNSGTISLANFFSTTTNSVAGQVLYYANNNGWPAQISSAATSTPSIGSVLTYSGTLGNFIGGTSGSFSIANNAISNSMLTNSNVTINTSGGLSIGGSVSLGGSLSLSSFSYPWSYLTNTAGSTFGTSTISTSTSYWTQGVFFSSSTAQASQFPYASSSAFTTGNLSVYRTDNLAVGEIISAGSNGTFLNTQNSNNNLILQVAGSEKDRFNSSGGLALLSDGSYGAPNGLSINGGVVIGSSYKALTPTTNGLLVQGQTGIGTTSSSALFAIHAASTTNFAYLFMVGSTTSYGTTTILSIDKNGTTTLGNFGLCGSSNALQTDANGKIQCGSTVSDERLKQDIQPIGPALADLMKLNIVSYHYKPDANMGNQEESGFLAQDVQKFFPDAVERMAPTPLTPDGTLEIKEPNLVAYAIKAIQELAAQSNGADNSQRLDAQQSELDALNAKIQTLQIFVSFFATLSIVFIGLALRRRA